MYYNFQKLIWATYNLSSAKLNSQYTFSTILYFLSKSSRIPRFFLQSFCRSFLSRQILLGFIMVVFMQLSFSSQALTSKTSNTIHGHAPYFTIDGGRTRVTNTEDLLSITLSNGTKYTPATNNSFIKPIELANLGETLANIDMLVPTDTYSINLSSLIAEPYKYFGDDDGDDNDDVTATGSLTLSIVDNNNQSVARNEALDICKAPYKLILSNTDGALTTRYGVPNSNIFNASNTTYYINPKISPKVCFAKPNLLYGSKESNLGHFAGPPSIWDPKNGFITQSFDSATYGLNFPTTGADGLYFDLIIGGVAQPLKWEEVEHEGIKATMTPDALSGTSVRVKLTGPVATEWESDSPDSIYNPSLPQTFELVGRDSSDNEVIKYGFELKQWFVNRGPKNYSYQQISWCEKIGYRITEVKDLTNAGCDYYRCEGAVGATPSSSDSYYERNIGAGLFAEWGSMGDYNANFNDILTSHWWYWTDEVVNQGNDYDKNYRYIVSAKFGHIDLGMNYGGGKFNLVCVSHSH